MPRKALPKQEPYRYNLVATRFWSDERVAALPRDAKLLALYLLTTPHRTMVGYYRLPLEYMVADLGFSNQKEPIQLQFPTGPDAERLPKPLPEPFAQPFGKPLPEPLWERFPEPFRNRSGTLAERFPLPFLSALSLLLQWFLEYDFERGIVFIKNALRYQRPLNPNQLKAAVRQVADVPKSPLLSGFLQAAQTHFPPLADALVKLFRERFGERFVEQLREPFREPLAEPFPKPFGKPLAEPFRNPLANQSETVPVNCNLNLKPISIREPPLSLPPLTADDRPSAPAEAEADAETRATRDAGRKSEPPPLTADARQLIDAVWQWNKRRGSLPAGERQFYWRQRNTAPRLLAKHPLDWWLGALEWAEHQPRFQRQSMSLWRLDQFVAPDYAAQLNHQAAAGASSEFREKWSEPSEDEAKRDETLA